MLDKFAEELKQAREKNEFTIQQLAAKTRIDIKFLEQMEFGDFSFLPDVYVRAFIKDYSKVVGLDEIKTLKKFEAAKKGQLFVEDNLQAANEKPAETNDETKTQRKKEAKQETSSNIPDTRSVPSYDSSSNSHSHSDGVKLNTAQIGIIAIVVLVLAVVVYTVFLRSSNDIIVPEKSYDEIINENQRYDEKPKQPGDSLSAITTSDSLILTIHAIDSSWIKIVSDGKNADDFILTPNSKKTVAAKKIFNITLGNSGGVNLYLNNRLLNFSGKRRTSMSFKIDASGISSLQNQL